MPGKGERPASVTLFLRLLCGGYLLYLAWDLFTGAEGGLVFYIAAAVFALVGAALVIFTLRAALKDRGQEAGEEGGASPPLPGGTDETNGKEE